MYIYPSQRGKLFLSFKTTLLLRFTSSLCTQQKGFCLECRIYICPNAVREFLGLTQEIKKVCAAHSRQEHHEIIAAVSVIEGRTAAILMQDEEIAQRHLQIGDPCCALLMGSCAKRFRACPYVLHAKGIQVHEQC